MKIRLAIHLLLLISLGALGAWLLQTEMATVKQGGTAFFDGLAGAMYWFAFLVFGLLSSLLYLSLRRAGPVALVSGYLLSAVVAVGATIAIVREGRQAALPEDGEGVQLPLQTSSLGPWPSSVSPVTGPAVAGRRHQDLLPSEPLSRSG